jgi:transposase
MGLRRRRFTKEFKLQVVREVLAGKSLAEAAREHQVLPASIVAWRKTVEEYPESAFQGNGNSYTAEAKIAELERMVGQQAMEIAFLKKVLSCISPQAPPAAENGKDK